MWLADLVYIGLFFVGAFTGALVWGSWSFTRGRGR